jgi:hypothetical protein
MVTGWRLTIVIASGIASNIASGISRATKKRDTSRSKNSRPSASVFQCRTKRQGEKDKARPTGQTPLVLAPESFSRDNEDSSFSCHGGTDCERAVDRPVLTCEQRAYRRQVHFPRVISITSASTLAPDEDN